MNVGCRYRPQHQDQRRWRCRGRSRVRLGLGRKSCIGRGSEGGGQGNCAAEAEENDDDLSAFGTDVDKADEEALDPDDWKMPHIPGRNVDDEVSFLVDGGVGDEGDEGS